MVGGNLTFDLPTGDFADAANLGIGLGVEGKYFISDQFAVGGIIGYQGFGMDIDGLKFSTLPILVTGEVFFQPGESIMPYTGLGLGIYTARVLSVVNPKVRGN